MADEKVPAGGIKKCGCVMRRPSLPICFAVLLSFLLIAAGGGYFAPDKLGTLFLWHMEKLQLRGRSPHEGVWPSPEFWQTLTMDNGRKMHNKCLYAACPSNISQDSQHLNGVNPSPFKHPFDPKQECPFYFRYIHEDLSPWKSGDTDKTVRTISREMLNIASPLSNFRVVIKKGRLFVDPLVPCFQTRAIFTVWSLLQLLRFYPGLVPDVEFVFGCGDTPRVFRKDFQTSLPPPVFRYCSTPTDFDIPFPDWSFWGWPEVNLKSWDGELSGILKGENELLWEERHPTAFWKGNTDTGSALRKALQSCNGPQNGATILHQNWFAEANNRFRDSKLAQQCQHRFKIYAEGWGWSVSLKYIMACDSPTFVIDPVFHDFFSRGLFPLKHFWPVRRDNICKSIKFGTKWGNDHTISAEAMGRAGRQYVTKELNMRHVYDYMLHLLYEYSKLLDFEPVPGENMKEVCVDAFLCQAPEQETVLYEESMVRSASEEPPCFLPPRDQQMVEARQARRVRVSRLVHDAEDSGDGGSLLLDIDSLLHR